MRKPHCLVGKTITRIELSDDQHAIRFHIEGGEPIDAVCDSDCCSHTWIEALDDPAAVIGSLVLEAKDVGSRGETRNEAGHECVEFYGFEIATDRGRCVIDYRNSSNGYYGGWLNWPVGEDEYSRVYGGVYGQNPQEGFTWVDAIKDEAGVTLSE